MRKSLILFAAFLFLSISALFAGHITVNRLQDHISITETTYAGDPAEAEELTVALQMQVEDQLFWHTSYAAGVDPAPETSFRFFATPQSFESTRAGSAYLLRGNTSLGMRGNDLDLTEEDNFWLGVEVPDMLLPAIDVAGRTQAGEIRTEILYLRDYYQYYTVGLSCTSVNMTMEDNQALAQYFRFPVPEEKQVEVRISKDDAGKIYRVQMGSVGSISEEEAVAPAETEEFPVYSGGVVTEKGVYLILWTVSGAEEVFSEISGGYGVYLIPVEDTGDIKPRVVVDQIQNIYPMDPERAQAVEIIESRDQTRLLLFTLEQGQLVLTVLDQETWEPLQRLPLPTNQTPSVYQTDGLLALRLWEEDQEYRLLAMTEEDGTYRLWLDTPLRDDVNLWSYNTPCFLFNGERLAIAFYEGAYRSCNICLTIYDSTGLLYAGQYANSADQLPIDMRDYRSSALALAWAQP